MLLVSGNSSFIQFRYLLLKFVPVELSGSTYEGTTNSLLSMLDQAALFWIIGAMYMSTALTMTWIVLQSECITFVGFLRSMRYPRLLSGLRIAPRFL